MVSMFPFLAWAAVIIIGCIVYIGVALAIEKSGLARLGATGNLFTCNPDANKVSGKAK